MDSAHKAERPRLCGRGRSSLFSIYLTWLQYAANHHSDFDCVGIIARPWRGVKLRASGTHMVEQLQLNGPEASEPPALQLHLPPSSKCIKKPGVTFAPPA